MRRFDRIINREITQYVSFETGNIRTHTHYIEGKMSCDTISHDGMLHPIRYSMTKSIIGSYLKFYNQIELKKHM